VASGAGGVAADCPDIGWSGNSKRTYLFESRKGTPLSAGNIHNRMLKPLCRKLGIAPGGFHAFRHGRVTVLRKNGTPADLQKLWIGHSSLRTGDRYSHADEELAFRRAAAGHVGLSGIVAAADTGAKTDAEVRANESPEIQFGAGRVNGSTEAF